MHVGTVDPVGEGAPASKKVSDLRLGQHQTPASQAPWRPGELMLQASSSSNYNTWIQPAAPNSTKKPSDPTHLTRGPTLKYAQAHTDVHAHTHAHESAHIHIGTHTYMCVHTYMYARVHICMYTRTYTRTYVQMHAHMYIHTHSGSLEVGGRGHKVPAMWQIHLLTIKQVSLGQCGPCTMLLQLLLQYRLQY